MRNSVMICLNLKPICMSRRDLERMSTPVFNVQAHNGLVNAIDGCGGLGIGGGAPEIVTGGRDGECTHYLLTRKATPT